LYVTEVACDPQGDVFFPTLNSDSWSEIFQEAHKADEKNAFDYTFKVLERKHLK
jgi:dihydrofolate reductase